MNKRPAKSLLFIIFTITVLIWGTTWIAIKVGLDNGAKPFWGTTIRFLFASVFMIIVLLIRRKKYIITKSHLRLILLHGLLMIAISNSLVFWGQQFIDPSLASILFAIFPLTVALMSQFFLKSSIMTVSKLFGIFLGLAGVVFIFFDPDKLNGGINTLFGMGAVLLSVIFISYPTIMIKRDGKDLDPFLLNTGGMIIGFLALSGLAFFMEGPPPTDLSQTSILALLYLGIFGSCVTFVAYFWLLKYVDVTKLSFSAYLTPILTVFASILFYHETFNFKNVIGMLIIFSGIFISDWKSYISIFSRK